MSGRSATGPRMTRRTTIATIRGPRKSPTRKRKAARKATRKSTTRKKMRMRR